MRKSRHISVTVSLPASIFFPPSLLLPSSFYSLTPPSCRLRFSRSPSLHPPLPLSVYPSLSVFFLPLSTRLPCALPVSQRIPLVAQLRDSAGKLRLFKARSAGKASSCWKEAAWTANQPSCLHTRTHKHRHMHTSHSESAASLLPCLPAFQT